VADSLGLQATQSRDDRNNHLLKFVLLPVKTLLFAFPKQILEIGATVHVFADHRDAVSVVHRLVEVIAEELKHVGMRLHFKQLDGFFLQVSDQAWSYLVLVQLVECLCFNFFDRVKLAGRDVLCFVDLGVLLACDHQSRMNTYPSQADQPF